MAPDDTLCRHYLRAMLQPDIGGGGTNLHRIFVVVQQRD
jgi:hypothetical protein